VETRIFYGIIVLFFISTSTAFAQESLLSVKTDDNHYDEGDTIVISGNVGIVIADTPIIIQIITEGAYAHFAQITVSQDGSFTETVLAEGKFWKKGGEYIVRASYQDKTVDIVITYTPKSEVIVTTTNFDVDVPGHGTFDVEYTIKGGHS